MTTHDDARALRERLAALETLAHEYERVQALIAAAAVDHPLDAFPHGGVVYVQPDNGQIIEVDDKAVALFGYSRNTLLGMSMADLELPPDTTDDAQIFRESSLELRVYTGRFRCHDGRVLPVRVSRHALDKAAGRVLRYQIEALAPEHRLWHELKRREDAGFSFQGRLKALNEITIALNQIDDYDALCRAVIVSGIQRLGFDRLGMWLIDTAAEKMIGTYGVDEHGQIRDERDQSWSYTGTQIMEFVAGQTDAALAHEDAPIYNQYSEIIAHGWHILVPMRNGATVIGVLTADNFLTKQAMKAYEPELLRLYGITIGHVIALAQARRQAFNIRLEQERSQMLRQFITSVGHDFRTPLAIINTKSYLSLRLPASDQRQALVGEIQQQVMYISNMLDAMLEFVALEIDLALKCTPADVQVLVQDIVDAHRAQLALKFIECEVSFQHAVIVPVDSQLLSRAVREIFENAIHYTPPGGRVEVRLLAYPGEVGIRIRDTGVGLTAEAIEQVFKPLFRVDTARTERRSGLGLSIAQRIVAAHGGRITVTSSPGAGSTFEIILPAG